MYSTFVLAQEKTYTCTRHPTADYTASDRQQYIT